MLIYFIKFIHILCVLGLLGTAIYNALLLSPKKIVMNNSAGYPAYFLNKSMLILALLSMLTGTLLVYPKHFTFHTHWVQAAYLLLLFFGFGVVGLNWLHKKQKSVWTKSLVCLILIALLFFIIHDAVTKNTFLF